MEQETLYCCPKCYSEKLNEINGFEYGYGTYFGYECRNCGHEFDANDGIEIPAPPYEWELQNREMEMSLGYR
jgi:hypothetical protein